MCPPSADVRHAVACPGDLGRSCRRSMLLPSNRHRQSLRCGSRPAVAAVATNPRRLSLCRPVLPLRRYALHWNVIVFGLLWLAALGAGARAMRRSENAVAQIGGFDRAELHSPGWTFGRRRCYLPPDAQSRAHSGPCLDPVRDRSGTAGAVNRHQGSRRQQWE